MQRQTVLILDCGGQHNQLIARRVRELGVYCEVYPSTVSLEKIKGKNPIGIIFSGMHDLPYSEGSPQADPDIFGLGLPILGIGYGAQLIAHRLGGVIAADCDRKECGITQVAVDVSSPLFSGLSEKQDVWMSHAGRMDKFPEGFVGAGQSADYPCAAFEDRARGVFGIQFYPQLQQTVNGQQILRNFLFGICKAAGDWTMESYRDQAIEEIRQKVGEGKVLLALSGGVDSSVVAGLLSKAIGRQLVCIFVDHGLMRKNEGDQVMAAFRDWDLDIIRVDAEQRFLEKLSGVSDPETKRKIIGEEFIRVFEQEAKKIGEVHFLAQGTIYPDVIESGGENAPVIKSHHNVGGLPEHLDFKEIIEPLRALFKDEVRKLGATLGLPDYLILRQPFPGPGLAVRVIGEITQEKLTILRQADFIFRQEIENAGLAPSINQYFAVLTEMRSVGIAGAERTYDYTLALRAVTTTDFMTADWARIPHAVLDKASTRIASEVRGVNRIVYDVTSKPPATIEWE